MNERNDAALDDVKTLALKLWNKVNEWRCRLIEWEHAGDVTPRDPAELSELQALADECIRVLAPLPIAELEAYMKSKGIEVPAAPDAADCIFGERKPAPDELAQTHSDLAFRRCNAALGLERERNAELEAQFAELRAKWPEAEAVVQSLEAQLAEAQRKAEGWMNRCQEVMGQLDSQSYLNMKLEQDRLREALEAYPEWMDDDPDGSPGFVSCLICGGGGKLNDDGRPSKRVPPTHKPDCARQAALNPREGEE